MVLKPDQQRIKDLLSETIALLCRSSLNFKSEFSIEALIGITLDQDDVFLVSIKETVRTNDSWTPPETWLSHQITGCCDGENTGLQGDVDCARPGTDVNSKVVTGLLLEDRLIVSQDHNKNLNYCQKPWRETVQNTNHKRHRKDPAPKMCPQRGVLLPEADDDLVDLDKQEKRPKISDLLETDKALETRESSGHSIVDRGRSGRLCSTFRTSYEKFSAVAEEDKNLEPNSPSTFNGLKISTMCNGAKPCSEPVGEKLCSSADVASEDEDDFKDRFSVIENEAGNKPDVRPRRKSKPRGKSPLRGCALSGRKYSSKGSAFGIMQPLAIQQVRPNVAGVWQVSASVPESASAARQWTAGPDGSIVESMNLNARNSEIPDGPPDITAEQAQMAVEVLSISGSFINIGSAKAFQHNLRKLTKNELSEVLEKMSVPATNSYCVGLLCTEGASRVFYKIPPPLIKEEALGFYSLDLSTYSNLYYGPVRVPHNVKEPYEWRCMLEMKSPFNFMPIDGSVYE